jgi:hypothetical protein
VRNGANCTGTNCTRGGVRRSSCSSIAPHLRTLSVLRKRQVRLPSDVRGCGR